MGIYADTCERLLIGIEATRIPARTDDWARDGKWEADHWNCILAFGCTNNGHNMAASGLRRIVCEYSKGVGLDHEIQADCATYCSAGEMSDFCVEACKP